MHQRTRANASKRPLVSQTHFSNRTRGRATSTIHGSFFFIIVVVVRRIRRRCAQSFRGYKRGKNANAAGCVGCARGVGKKQNSTRGNAKVSHVQRLKRNLHRLFRFSSLQRCDARRSVSSVRRRSVSDGVASRRRAARRVKEAKRSAFETSIKKCVINRSFVRSIKRGKHRSRRGGHRAISSIKKFHFIHSDG